jgi:dipeptidyl aminopeptidase/acylaminoacyl peptidase
MLLVAPACFAAGLPPLIPRVLLLGNPQRANPTISPDAKRLAWLAPDRRGVMQVWVRTRGSNDDRAVTNDAHRGISSYRWSYDSRTILYAQDLDGDENYHVYAAYLDSGNVRDLTPWMGVRARILALNPKFPSTMLVTLNLRDRKLMDVWRIDLGTGAARLDTQNPGDVDEWIADNNLVVRAAAATTADAGTEIRVRDGTHAPWRTIEHAGPEEELFALDFSRDGRALIMGSSLGSDTTRLMLRDLPGGRERTLASNPAADLDDVMIHPTAHIVQAVAFDPGRKQWTAIDPHVRTDFAAFAHFSGGNFDVVSRDLADTFWIVNSSGDRLAPRYYLWDRVHKGATMLFDSRPKLEGAELAATQPFDFTARDGMRLHGYLTLPPGIAAKNLAAVIAVHGGPWARATWGFNGMVQLLANRGYAVIDVNYRGSAGFGKEYLHAGDRQWGRKMQDDLVDAKKWAVDSGVVDPNRVAIVGGSYGGYAALAGAAFDPAAFKCAVDVCGPANLFTLFASMPPYWATSVRKIFVDRVGDPDNPADKAMLTAASPLFSADKIRIPLLMGQGAHDVRVKPAEAEQMVAALAKNHGRATYVVYADEGHGFHRPENNLDFNARMEKFLADNLGGRFEPMSGERIAGSTATVREIGSPASSTR